MKNNNILLRDIGFIALFLLLISTIFFLTKSNGENGAYAVIKKDNEVIYKVSLESDSENFTVNGIENMTFTVKDNKIAVIYSDCPDKVCVNTGFLSNTGEIAVCLPNKVTVEIIGNSSDEDIDFLVR